MQKPKRWLMTGLTAILLAGTGCVHRTVCWTETTDSEAVPVAKLMAYDCNQPDESLFSSAAP